MLGSNNPKPWVAPLVLSLSLLGTGCPGQKRPAPTRAHPKSSALISKPSAGSLKGIPKLRQQFNDLKAQHHAYLQKKPTQPTWSSLVKTIDASQSLAFDLQERVSPAEEEELYLILEALDILRDEVVSQEPGAAQESQPK